MTVEDQLRQAMVDEVADVARPADRWHDVEAQAGTARRVAARRRARRRMGGLAVLAVAATAAAALFALPAITRDPPRRVVVTPSGHPTTVVSPQATTPTTTTGVTGTTAATGTTGVTKAVTPTTATPVAGSSYQPLYPFPSLQAATAWQASYRATGAQPWHLDPGQTALSFTGFLGYTDVTTVFGVRNDSTGAHVTVGFPNPNGAAVNAAVVHLRRFGTGPTAPWEVVGTDDTSNFSLTNPRYGTTIRSPLAVGGAILGVDENIRVQVLQGSSPTPLGVYCCQPAGSSGAPWAATVTFHGASDDILIVAASTGGHLATVERFTVTGVRTKAGTTPGL
jgi:hypothetical protein